MNLLKIIKEYVHNRPKIKKVIGVILIFVGLSALITPFTPGSWLAIIGLELLGIRILFFERGCIHTLMSYKKDAIVVCAIFFLAALLRLPALHYPAESVFDEHFYQVTISSVHNAEPFFDVHPPLATLLFEGIIHQKTFIPIVRGESQIGVPFGDFPYHHLRFFVAIIGSLLPAILYIIARLIGVEVSLAVLPAFFVLFDNALVIYSRSILPDTLLLFFGFLGLAFWLLSRAVQKRSAFLFLFLLAIMCFSAASSIKWTGLGFLGATLLYEAYRRNIGRVFFGIFGVWVIYILVFVVFFARLTGQHIESAYKVDARHSIRFTQEKSIINFSRFFIQYHKAMLQAHRSYDMKFEGHKHPAASRPYQWPLNQKVMSYWTNQNSTAWIILSGNLPAWIASLLAVASLIILTVFKMLGHTLPVVLPESTFFLLGGFLISYIPLFFIGRSLFLYHYFPTLLFGYLMVPTIFSFWMKLLPPTFSVERLVKVLLAAIIMGYIAFIPQIYGIPSLFAVQHTSSDLIER